MHSIVPSMTKTIDIEATPVKVFEFLANPLNWPQFAVVNLKSIKSGQGNTYPIISKNGAGELLMIADKPHRILDHVWKDSQGTWHVYMRVIPNKGGSTLITTFFKPNEIDSKIFEKSMQEMDLEFGTLKSILEGSL
jgi:hypothetical protein